MTLIKFIKYQTRDHFLKRVPFELKLALFIIVIVMVAINNVLSFIISLFILLAETVLLVISTKDVSYILEIYLAYLALFIIVYLPAIFWGNFDLSLLRRLGFIYTIAFTSMFMFASTDIGQLEAFMRRIHIPEKMIIAISLAWNFLPSTYAELNQVILTQKSRGLDLENPLKRLFYGLTILIPFLVISLIRLRTLTDALRVRGSD